MKNNNKPSDSLNSITPSELLSNCYKLVEKYYVLSGEFERELIGLYQLVEKKSNNDAIKRIEKMRLSVSQKDFMKQMITTNPYETTLNCLLQSQQNLWKNGLSENYIDRLIAEKKYDLAFAQLRMRHSALEKLLGALKNVIDAIGAKGFKETSDDSSNDQKRSSSNHEIAKAYQDAREVFSQAFHCKKETESTINQLRKSNVLPYKYKNKRPPRMQHPKFRHFDKIYKNLKSLYNLTSIEFQEHLMLTKQLIIQKEYDAVPEFLDDMHKDLQGSSFEAFIVNFEDLFKSKSYDDLLNALNLFYEYLQESGFVGKYLRELYATGKHYLAFMQLKKIYNQSYWLVWELETLSKDIKLTFSQESQVLLRCHYEELNEIDIWINEILAGVIHSKQDLYALIRQPTKPIQDNIMKVPKSADFLVQFEALCDNYEMLNKTYVDNVLNTKLICFFIAIEKQMAAKSYGEALRLLNTNHEELGSFKKTLNGFLHNASAIDDVILAPSHQDHSFHKIIDELYEKVTAILEVVNYFIEKNRTMAKQLENLVNQATSANKQLSPAQPAVPDAKHDMPLGVIGQSHAAYFVSADSQYIATMREAEHLITDYMDKYQNQNNAREDVAKSVLVSEEKDGVVKTLSNMITELTVLRDVLLEKMDKLQVIKKIPEDLIPITEYINTISDNIIKLKGQLADATQDNKAPSKASALRVDTPHPSSSRAGTFFCR